MTDDFSLFSRCDWCHVPHGVVIVREAKSRLHYAIKAASGEWVTFPGGWRVAALGEEFAGSEPEQIELKEVADIYRGYHTLCDSCARRFEEYRKRKLQGAAPKKRKSKPDLEGLENLPTLFSLEDDEL